MSVKRIWQAQENLELLYSRGCSPLSDCRSFSLICLQSLVRNSVPQKIHCCQCKRAFIQPCIIVFGAQHVEHSSKMVFVLLYRLWIDANIVEINDDPFPAKFSSAETIVLASVQRPSVPHTSRRFPFLSEKQCMAGYVASPHLVIVMSQDNDTIDNNTRYSVKAFYVGQQNLWDQCLIVQELIGN